MGAIGRSAGGGAGEVAEGTIGRSARPFCGRRRPSVGRPSVDFTDLRSALLSTSATFVTPSPTFARLFCGLRADLADLDNTNKKKAGRPPREAFFFHPRQIRPAAAAEEAFFPPPPNAHKSGPCCTPRNEIVFL